MSYTTPAVLVSVFCDGFAGTLSVLFIVWHVLYVMHIIITYTMMLLLLILKRALKWGSWRVNLTIQPTTVLDRLKEGCYLRLIMGATDAV